VEPLRVGGRENMKASPAPGQGSERGCPRKADFKKGAKKGVYTGIIVGPLRRKSSKKKKSARPPLAMGLKRGGGTSKTKKGMRELTPLKITDYTIRKIPVNLLKVKTLENRKRGFRSKGCMGGVGRRR